MSLLFHRLYPAGLQSHLLVTGGGGGVILGLPRRGNMLLVNSGSLLPPKCLPRFLPHSSAGRRGMTKPVDIPGVTAYGTIVSLTLCLQLPIG